MTTGSDDSGGGRVNSKRTIMSANRGDRDQRALENRQLYLCAAQRTPREDLVGEQASPQRRGKDPDCFRSEQVSGSRGWNRSSRYARSGSY
jgi:hypothetical protein